MAAQHRQPGFVASDVLAQLGSRIAHQLRAHTPDDAKALKATVNTFPRSSYDLAELLTQLGIGQAVVTVMDPDGVPTPVLNEASARGPFLFAQDSLVFPLFVYLSVPLVCEAFPLHIS